MVQQQPQSSNSRESPPTVSLSSWIRVATFLRPDWTSDEATFMFFKVDHHHVGQVDLEEFYQLCSFIGDNIAIERRVSHSQDPGYQRVLRQVLEHRLELLTNGVSVVSSDLVMAVLILVSIVQAVEVNDAALGGDSGHTVRRVVFRIFIYVSIYSDIFIIFQNYSDLKRCF